MSAIHPGQWRLEEIELLNWGTFQGHWSVPVARRGFLVTGPSASGKSSLLDAVAAVLTPRGKLRFNAAANDGGARGEDRSLVSYIRGAWRRSADAETGEVASEYLRPAATYSGVLLRYADSTGGKPVALVKLYHLRRGTNTPADIQELSLILRDDTSLADFVPHLGSGVDVRRIKAAWPDAVEATDKHSRFAARFSRMLGISGENAVLLLHKTQAAKSLGNLDELFRSFMLDEPKTFAQAENAVAQFAELSQAHAAVVEARRQRDHLQGMAGPARDYEASAAAATEAGTLAAAVPAFKDAWKLRLAEDARVVAGERLLAVEHAAGEATDSVRDLYDALAVARQRVAESGGAAVQTQREWIRLAEGKLADITARRSRLDGRLEDVGLQVPRSFADFEELRTAAGRERDAWAAGEEAARNRLLELHDRRAAARHEHDSLEQDITVLRRQRSNLDRRLLEARTRVAAAAGLPEQALPFAGELLEVDAGYAGWTGAIERVLRPLATLMLVPQAHRNGLGLAARPDLVRVRFLDRALAPGGLGDISAPVADLAALDIAPRVVFVVENLETILAIPAVEDAVVVHGSGYAVERLDRIPWVRDTDVVYWGDLDSHGFAILNRLRSHGVAARSVLMDAATLDAYADLCVPEPQPSTATLEYLTTAEHDAMALLADRGNVRLEQERIDWGHAVDVLTRAAGDPAA